MLLFATPPFTGPGYSEDKLLAVDAPLWLMASGQDPAILMNICNFSVHLYCFILWDDADEQCCSPFSFAYCKLYDSFLLAWYYPITSFKEALTHHSPLSIIHSSEENPETPTISQKILNSSWIAVRVKRWGVGPQFQSGGLAKKPSSGSASFAANLLGTQGHKSRNHLREKRWYYSTLLLTWSTELVPK